MTFAFLMLKLKPAAIANNFERSIAGVTGKAKLRRLYRVTGPLDSGDSAPFDYLQISSTDGADIASDPLSHAELQDFLIMEQSSFVKGELVPEVDARRVENYNLALFLHAKLKSGVSAEEYLQWIREIDYPLVRSVKSVLGMDVFHILDALPGGAAPPYDHLSAAYITSVPEFKQERERNLGTRTISKQFPDYFQMPPFSHVVARQVIPS